MNEPCPFKVGDLVRYIDDDPRDALAGAVGTVIEMPVWVYKLSSETDVPKIHIAIALDYPTQTYRVKKQMVTIKFWQDAAHDHTLNPEQVEKVEP